MIVKEHEPAVTA